MKFGRVNNYLTYASGQTNIQTDRETHIHARRNVKRTMRSNSYAHGRKLIRANQFSTPKLFHRTMNTVGYFVLVVFAKEVMFSSLFVCLSVVC